LLLKPSQYLVVVNQLASTSLRNIHPDCSAEMGFLFDRTQGQVFHPMLSILTRMGSYLRNLGFLLRRKSTFIPRD